MNAPLCRLFCFPHAGGAASLYHSWAAEMPPGVELVAIQLPGREQRLSEEAFVRMETMLPELVEAILPLADRPFAFLGHSLGAFVSFEVARALKMQRGIEPVHLFVAAQRAPHLPNRRQPLRDLPDEEFIEEIRRRFQGIPDEVVANEGLMEVILMSLRPDIEMNETYEYRPEPKLSCPITVLHGEQDHSVSEDMLSPWSEETDGPCQVRSFSGDHFFVQSSATEIQRAISAELRPLFESNHDPMPGISCRPVGS